ncbi:MAG: murein transglycosylase A [Planctomycetota bacterium]
MPRRPLSIIALAALLGGLVSCAQQASAPEPIDPYDYELAAGEYGIERLPAWESAPDFSIGWQRRGELLDAAQRSLNYLSKPSSQGFFPVANGEITHDLMVRSVERFAQVLEDSRSAEEFLRALDRDFEVWVSRGRSGTGDVFFTGYGTPILDGAMEQGGAYQYPLYRLPDDLVKDDDGTIRGRMASDGGIVPYYTAAELRDNGHLVGTELVWLTNPFDAYIAQVQGSAVIRMPSGELYEVGYAGKNGHGYTSIGMILIDEGKISRSELSLQALRDYFEANPAEADRVLPMNPSFVFFQESAGGPYGCLGQPVTAMHSIATDKDVFPRAALVYVEARLPEFDRDGDLVQRPVRFFALDQDRGGAIRSAGRCDIYMGLGDDAMARAGYVGSRGRMYYLFLHN